MSKKEKVIVLIMGIFTLFFAVFCIGFTVLRINKRDEETATVTTKIQTYRIKEVRVSTSVLRGKEIETGRNVIISPPYELKYDK